MKIIFLDVDGVLNDMSYYEASGYDGAHPLSPWALVNLQRLVKQSGAELVLSSSWRSGWDKNPAKCGDDGRILNQFLGFYDMKIFDKTGHYGKSFLDSRCMEIRNWLKETDQEIESFVILDDADYRWDKCGLRPFLVQTDYRKDGLTEQHVEKALKILSEGKNPFCPNKLQKFCRDLGSKFLN